VTLLEFSRRFRAAEDRKLTRGLILSAAIMLALVWLSFF
jgi:hypothetical protein